jgi:hypothetical protein
MLNALSMMITEVTFLKSCSFSSYIALRLVRRGNNRKMQIMMLEGKWYLICNLSENSELYYIS